MAPSVSRPPAQNPKTRAAWAFGGRGFAVSRNGCSRWFGRVARGNKSVALRLRSLGWTSLSPAPALPGRMTAPSLRTVYRDSLPVTQETSAGGSGRAAGLVRETSCSLLPARRGVSRIKAWIPRASSVRYARKSLLRLHREGDNFQLSRERDPPPSLKRRARINRINGLDG